MDFKGADIELESDSKRDFDLTLNSSLRKKLFSNSNQFVSCLTSTDDTNLKICSAISNRKLYIFDINDIDKPLKISTNCHADVVTKVKFIDNNVLVSCSLDRNLKFWDLRSQNHLIQSLEGENSLTTLDYHSGQNVVCTGSECENENAFITFWDLRNFQSVGSYSECHSMDISKVEFHGDNYLVSSSIDNLINIYDLNESSEDDALIATFNCTTGVVNFEILNRAAEPLVCALTDLQDIQFWHFDQMQLFRKFSKKRISRLIQDTPGNEYDIVNIHRNANKLLLMVNMKEASKSSDGDSDGDGDDRKCRACGLRVDVEDSIQTFQLNCCNGSENGAEVLLSDFAQKQQTLMTIGSGQVLELWRFE